MEVSGKPHTPVDLPLQQVLPILIEWVGGWGSEVIWTLWRRGILLPLPTFKHWID
jgi:hypothetical protein